jgi:anti-anti-sigma factor
MNLQFSIATVPWYQAEVRVAQITLRCGQMAAMVMESAVECPMEMTVEQLADGIKKVHLVGELDIVGTGKVDLAFSALAGSADKVLIDLSGLDFLASIGIRTLVLGAQVVNRRGGKMVAFNAQPMVEKVLRTSGTVQLIPIFNDAASALAALQA